MQNTNNSAKKIVPVILSGGMGTRLWPMSRGNYPKQFLNLGDSKLSLIQQTVSRVSDPSLFHQPVIVSNIEHRFLVAEQIKQIGVQTPHILLEPKGRNTAPAIAAASIYVEEVYGKEAIILVLPSDHIVRDNEAFIEGIKRAKQVASQGKMITFGATPTYPETGYGYIQPSTAIHGVDNSFDVASFIEKPPLDKAKEYVKSGYYWNSGSFMFSIRDLRQEFSQHQPSMYELCKKAVDRRVTETDFVRLDNVSFMNCASDSIDYAIMEKSDNIAVVGLDCGSSDAGSWESLWKISDKDDNGNVNVGDNYLLDTKDSYIMNNGGPAVTTIGVKDMAIVSTKDSVLVMDKHCSQQVKQAVEAIRADNSALVDSHSRVYRPWGYYESIDTGSRHQVKRINVSPGAKLSLQMHYHRAEHWIVVRGTAKVTCGHEVKLVSENQSVYIPCGEIHRVENPGKMPLDLIEVQSGSYLGEDDIVRFEDQYGRSEQKQADTTANPEKEKTINENVA